MIEGDSTMRFLVIALLGLLPPLVGDAVARPSCSCAVALY
jgi:hypothetical protein